MVSAQKNKKAGRGRKQDRARVAAGQKHEVRYEKKKTGKSASTVKRVVKAVGNIRKKSKGRSDDRPTPMRARSRS